METTERFFKLLDALEENLDKGFFLSFIGKIIVDEKKIYSVLNELRSLAPESLRAAEAAPRTARTEEPPAPQFPGATVSVPANARRMLADVEQQARAVRDGADRYAEDVLSDLEERIARLLGTIREGRRVLKTRIGSEVTPNATPKI